MKNYIYILIISFLVASEGVHIDGYIYTEQDSPIENVEIRVESLSIGTTSDQNGFFRLLVPNNGFHELLFSHIGYKEYIYKIDDTTTKNSLEITLELLPIENNQIVITSNRKETLIKESPNLTYLINSNDIKTTSSSTVKEIIEFAIPNIQSIHDNHGNNKIKIQGLDSKYVTFLLDGNKISGEFAGGIDFSLFNLYNVEKIEIVRGGLSTLYGSGAMGSVINIITNKRLNSYWLNTSMNYDKPLIFNKSFSAGINYKKISYSLFINHKSSDGYDLTSFDYLGGVTTDINKTLESYNSISITQKLGVRLNENLDVLLNFKNYSKEILKYRQVNTPFINCNCLQNENPYFTDRFIAISLKKKVNAKSNLLISYQDELYSKSYYYPYYNTPIHSLISEEEWFDFNSLKLDGEKILWSTPNTRISSIIYDVKLKKHLILAGVDYVDESYQSKDIYNASGDTIYVSSIFNNNQTYNIYETSFFITDNFNISQVELSIGLRSTYQSRYKTRYSPSISIRKQQFQDYNIRLNYSHNYRNPSIKELYYEFPDHQAGFPVIGNSRLNPSTSDYYSTSIESRKYSNNSIELYYNHVNNIIANKFQEVEGAIVYMYHNYKQVDLYGLNINSSFTFFKNLTLNSVYSYTEANSNFEDIMDGISRHSINMRLNYIFSNDMNIGLLLHYNSKKTVDVSLEDQNNNRTEIDLPQYSLTNITFTKSFMSNLHLKLGVKNLFDYTADYNINYPDFLSSYTPGRRFFASINIDFSRDIK